MIAVAPPRRSIRADGWRRESRIHISTPFALLLGLDCAVVAIRDQMPDAPLPLMIPRAALRDVEPTRRAFAILVFNLMTICPWIKLRDKFGRLSSARVLVAHNPGLSQVNMERCIEKLTCAELVPRDVLIRRRLNYLCNDLYLIATRLCTKCVQIQSLTGGTRRQSAINSPSIEALARREEMFNNRTTSIVIVLSFLITSVVLGSQNRTLAQDQGGLSLKSGSALEDAASKGGPLRSGPIKLIASSVSFPLPGEPPLAVLVPASVTAVETLETPVVVSVTVPQDSRRTHLLLVFNTLNTWLKVTSTAPFAFRGENRITFTSDALPDTFTITASDLNAQADSQPSTGATAFLQGASTSFALDEKLTARLLRARFVNLTEQQASELAKELIKCEIKMDMSVRVTLRSVNAYNLINAFLQVWGDGRGGVDHPFGH